MIDTTKYYWNKELHTATAELANEKAATRKVQVSRWVNNSKGRQIVTYIVHTGERNDFASRQDGILFQVSEDAGRGGRIENEMDMLNAVIKYLNTPINGFWLCDESSAGETWTATEDSFANEINSGIEIWSLETEEEVDNWRKMWQWITRDDILDNERLRDNLIIDLKRHAIFDDRIIEFINEAVAAAEAAAEAWDDAVIESMAEIVDENATAAAKTDN
jgi:hypothetical protein